MAPESPTADALPVYVVDPTWPPTLPNDWILGDIRGLFADDNDHLWVILIYTHVLNQGGRGVRSPLDQLGPGPRRT